MLFNSYVFIFLFLPVVFAGYLFLRRYPQRVWVVGWLVLASLFYYAWWKPQFVLLVVGSVAVNAIFGKVLIAGELGRGTAKAVLALGLAFNLGVLAYFKYAMFFVANVNALFGSGYTVPSIILPIGISFITFQKIAFLVDAYRGEVRNFSLPNFALFVTFFPQLIAGPIVHHSEVMPQFAREPAAPTVRADVAIGLSIFIVGLFKKVVVADTFAVFADAGYETLKGGGQLDFASGWIAVLSYSLQLYYDFSGYSDMAVGLARMFGVRFPVNFHSPYKATGIIDFWRRWHITLSRFLRDYLYIPLGGNRSGELRRSLNITVVMLLGGLWHGANWTFVVWGGIHGALLGINHAWHGLRVARLPVMSSLAARALFIVTTFVVVTLAWVPFRADNLREARKMFATLLSQGGDIVAAKQSLNLFWTTQFADPQKAWDLLTWFKAREYWPKPLPPEFLATYQPAGMLLAIVLAATLLLPNTNQIFARFDPVLGLTGPQLRHWGSVGRLDWKVALVISGMFVFVVLQLSRVSPFLYFQF